MTRRLAQSRRRRVAILRLHSGRGVDRPPLTAKQTVIVVALILTSSCISRRNMSSPPPVEPHRSMSLPAYKDGLATVLEQVPAGLDRYYVDVARGLYDLAFRSGELTRLQNDHAEADLHYAAGCLQALAELPGFEQAFVKKTAGRCLVLSKEAAGRMEPAQGALYASTKRLVAEKGIEAQDERIAVLFGFAFEVGYLNGFESPSAVNVYESAKKGCVSVALAVFGKDLAREQCSEIATKAQDVRREGH